ncbi:kinase-like domain-containing protein [Mycena latifolia]|nr:kinase-like domain-containing protein [Mycena latifolia]
MIRLDLSTTRAAGLEVLLGGSEAPRKDTSDNAGSVKMTFVLPGTPPATHWLARVPAPGFQHQHSFPQETFVFEQQLDQGIVGPVFAGRVAGDETAPVVAKVALYEAETRMLLHEATIYRQLQHLQGRAIPHVFGVFACRAFTVLVLAHRGARIAQMSELSNSQRLSLYEVLKLVHRWGVVHGDLRADNIVVADDGVPSLIDFSHARKHQCLGASLCEELCEARSFFFPRNA